MGQHRLPLHPRQGPGSLRSSCSHWDCHNSLDSTNAKSRLSLSTICSEISASPVLALVRSWLEKVQLKKQIWGITKERGGSKVVLEIGKYGGWLGCST